MPNTPVHNLPYPAPGTPPSTRRFLTNLAASVETALIALNNTLRGLITAARDHAEDAHLINGSSSVASSDTDVQTAQLDLGGASRTLPASAGATVVATFAVECNAWNGSGVFEGRLRVIRLSDGSAVETMPRPAVWSPGIVVPRMTLTTTFTIPSGAYPYGYGLQLSCIRVGTGAGYRVLAGLTKITVVQHRSGVR